MKTSIFAPKIVGIVNITSDSFSDGGRYLTTDAAISHARELFRAGAHFVELGPASSNPDAATVSSSEEIERIAPVIELLNQENIPFGLDSFQPETQKFAAIHGACFINDIQGFPDSTAIAPLISSNAKLVVMHAMQQSAAKADRKTYCFEEVWAHLLSFFERRISELLDAGVPKDRLIVDPGMGFFLSADPSVSIQVLKQLPTLRTIFDYPLFLSVSRKSFLQKLASVSAQDSGPATLMAELYCSAQGASYIRTHDPRALRTALAINGHLFG